MSLFWLYFVCMNTFDVFNVSFLLHLMDKMLVDFLLTSVECDKLRNGNVCRMLLTTVEIDAHHASVFVLTNVDLWKKDVE
jgi:hypothetical protein